MSSYQCKDSHWRDKTIRLKILFSRIPILTEQDLKISKGHFISTMGFPGLIKRHLTQCSWEIWGCRPGCDFEIWFSILFYWLLCDNATRWMPRHLTDDVNFGPGNGLRSSGNKPLPEPMLTQIYVVILRYYARSALNRPLICDDYDKDNVALFDGWAVVG